MKLDLDGELAHYSKFIWHPEETHLAEEFKNESSLLDKPLSTDSKVQGNIHSPEYLDFWEQVLKVDLNFVRFLKEGYALPFKNGVPPPSVFAKNNRSFREKKQFGVEEIKRLE